ncbi:MAG: phage/plasmid primase, P4 family [Planctomycetota bacterium]
MSTSTISRADTIPGLFPPHYRELSEGSGLTDATITAAGIYSEARYDKLAQILDWNRYPKRCAPAWVVPYRHPDGSEMGYARIKPDKPRNANGKPVKYESPRKRDNEPYFPPGVGPTIDNPAAPLLITEGEKKTLAATQAGFPCIGLVGVYGWKNKRAERLLPALERIPWKQRPVFIAFDSDLTDKPEIQDAVARLAMLLTGQGAVVRVVYLPDGPPDKSGKPTKTGLDDCLLTHKPGDLQKLIDAAEEPERPDPATIRVEASNLDPATEGRRILSADTADELYRLRFWKGTFWHWKAGGYRGRSAAEVKGAAIVDLNKRAYKLTGRIVSDIIDQLRAQSMLSYDIEPPAWLGKPPRPWEPVDILATKTGLVHLPSLVDGKKHLLPATPRYFSPAALDYGFAIDAPEPSGWLAFLDSLWPDDPESIDCLQEWFGLCLTPDTSHQKTLMLIGPKRSGKGTIARVLTGLIGRANVCGPTLASLATNFGMWSLVGKTAAIISDARMGSRTDSHLVTERLLSISGEDSLDIDRKFEKPITMKLLTRIMVLSNELPRLADQSGALASRMILLGLDKSFYGKEDRTLTARLLTELPGILKWAVIGWARLRRRGHFLQPVSGEELLGELHDLASPVGQFVAECCEVGPAYTVARDDLFEAYAAWAKASGRTYFEDRAGFGRALRAAVSAVRTTHPRVSGARQRTYLGIGVKLRPTHPLGWISAGIDLV